MSKIRLDGSMTVQENETFIAIDPCYDGDELGSKIEHLLPGQWMAEIEKKNFSCWGNRICKLTVAHQEHGDAVPSQKVPGDVGVDSGQAGIFITNRRKGSDDEPSYYNDACEVTLGRLGAGLMPDGSGFVSSSGFGDGGYNAYFSVENYKVVAVSIVFISEDEDDEDR